MWLPRQMANYAIQEDDLNFLNDKNNESIGHTRR